MKRAIKRIGHLCAGMAVLAFLLTSAWWLNQALSVDTWTIHGVPEYLETSIDKEMNAMKSLDFVHAWPSRLRRILLARLPDLADVSIARRLPDRLEITAKERKNAGVVKTGALMRAFPLAGSSGNQKLEGWSNGQT